MKQRVKTIINTGYCGIQGTYWMFFGVTCSFASVFLLDKGYNNSTIGIILAGGSILAVLLQPIVATLADKQGRGTLTNFLFAGVILFALLTGGLLFFHGKSITVPIIFIILIAGITLLQPIVNALSFALSKKGVYINFGVARSVGSLAYSAMAIILGVLVEAIGAKAIPVAGEVVLVALMISIITVRHYERSLSPNYVNMEKEEAEIGLREFIRRNKVFVIVSVGVIGLFFGNAVLNNFMMQIVSNVSGTTADMGRVLSIMAFLEIPTMVIFDRIRRKVSCSTLIKVATLGFFIKISLCYFAKSMTMIYIAQGAQLISFGLFLPAMVHFIDEIMSRREAVKGHSLFVIMTTIGSVFASLGGGIILDLMGAKALLLVAVVLTLLGGTIINLFIKKVPKVK